MATEPHTDGSAPGIIAWATDRATGAARHISEVAVGLACNCKCAACGHPLEAVNARRVVWKKRPHFRHHRGVEREGCRLLAARDAVRRLLQEDGYFQLPARTIVTSVTGASGRAYSGSAHVGGYRAKITQVHLVDRAIAILRLDDGRELEVRVAGSIDRSDEEPPLQRASVMVDLDGLGISEMSPEELRERLFLAPETFTWCSHWEDSRLRAESGHAGMQAAVEAADWDPEFTGPTDWARESALHKAVKEIVDAERFMMLPELRVRVKRSRRSLFVSREDLLRTARRVDFSSVRLESRLGRVIPDVVASIGPHDLLVEVTVTHGLSDVKEELLRAIDLPVLEIDLRSYGGLISRPELRELVLNQVECKRWVYHPLQRRRYEQLADEVEAELLEQEVSANGAFASSGAPPLIDMAPAKRDGALDSAEQRHSPVVPSSAVGSRATVAEDYARATGRAPDKYRRQRNAPDNLQSDADLFLRGEALEDWIRQNPERWKDIEPKFGHLRVPDRWRRK